MKKGLLLLLLLLGMAWNVSSQCDGNLGENIFTDGDFGTGGSNILFANPQIAPGYTYQISPPPDDGNYTITNNTSSWGSFAESWADIGDNSSDPNGYMMVVNASFEPSLFYEQEVDGLCENTLYVFSADIFNLLMGGGGIRPNVSFLLDGEIVYGTGNIPPNQMWNTYGFLFTTKPGQTSVLLALQNNAPGGIGNDLAIDNITFRPCGPQAMILPETIANICEDGAPIDLEATILGDQYDTPFLQWQQSFDEGLTWVDLPGETDTIYTHTNLSGGFYYYRYLLANGPSNLANSKCRVVSNIKVVRVLPKFYTIIDTLCQGLSFPLKDSLYSETGVYTDSLLNFLGCDSIVTLDLTIVPDVGIDVTFNVLDPSCDYLENGSVNIDAVFNATPPYVVYINGELSTDGSLTNLSAGAYNYQLIDAYGCEFDGLVSLQIPAPFFVDLGEDQVLELGETLLLEPQVSAPIDNYLWESNGIPICEADCETLTWWTNSSTSVSLTATSLSGCVAADSLLIEVVTVRKVFIPNVFTPNFDGFNDYFTIYGGLPNVQEVEQLTVFNRWGAVVFEQKGFLPNQELLGWDGTFKGKTLAEGLYTYLARIRFLDEQVILYEGGVTLLK